MTEAQIWQVALSSSVIAAIVSAAINLWIKRNEYSNDYYKMVITKRIAAYEQLECLIIGLKTSVLDKDNKPYHLIFAKDDDWLTAHKLLQDVMEHALWLSEKIFEKTRELNYLIFGLSQGNVIEFGKANYEKIATLREDMEKILAADMLELHHIRKFLREKKRKQSGFHPVNLGAKNQN